MVREERGDASQYECCKDEFGQVIKVSCEFFSSDFLFLLAFFLLLLCFAPASHYWRKFFFAKCKYTTNGGKRRIFCRISVRKGLKNNGNRFPARSGRSHPAGCKVGKSLLGAAHAGALCCRHEKQKRLSSLVDGRAVSAVFQRVVVPRL